MEVTPTAPKPFSAPPAPGPAAPLHTAPSHRALADRVEQMFLEEMLKHCGPGALSGSFGGGAGEEQFASFLTREHAAMLARRLDLGLGAHLDSALQGPQANPDGILPGRA